MRFLPSIICPRFMSCAKGQTLAFFCLAWVAAGLLFFFPSPVQAGEKTIKRVDLVKENIPISILLPFAKAFVQAGRAFHLVKAYQSDRMCLSFVNPVISYHVFE